MSNRIDYAKASPAGYKAFGGVLRLSSKLRPSKRTDLSRVSAGFANKWLRILHRYAFPRSAQARRYGRQARTGAGVARRG